MKHFLIIRETVPLVVSDNFSKISKFVKAWKENYPSEILEIVEIPLLDEKWE